MPSMSFPDSSGPTLPTNYLGLKQCRSASEAMDTLEARARGNMSGAYKTARTDVFHRPSDLMKMQNYNLNACPSAGAMVLTSSGQLADGRRLGWSSLSTSNSCAPEDSQLGNEQGNVVTDARLLRQISLAPVPAYNGAAQAQGGRPLVPYQYPFQNQQSSLHQSTFRPNLDPASGPFSTSQWMELENQALIFKYMIAGLSVPHDVLNPVLRSLPATISHHALHSFQAQSATNWPPVHCTFGIRPDSNPGQCRRTDGKKWRCKNATVPDQKYCERHIHRGRHRNRKPAQDQSALPQTQARPAPAPIAATSAPTTQLIPATRSITPTPPPTPTPNLNPNLNSSPFPPNSVLKRSLYAGLSGAHGSGNSNPGSSSSGLWGQPWHNLPKYTRDFNVPPTASKAPWQTTPGGGSGTGTMLEAKIEGQMQGHCKAPWQTPGGGSGTMMEAKIEGQGNCKGLFGFPAGQELLGLGQVQDQFGFAPEASEDAHAGAASQGAGGHSYKVEAEMSEELPLRHFFNDWPRARADPMPTGLAWESDVEADSDRTTSTGRGCQSSVTQLSISIPTTPSCDYNSHSSGSGSGGLASRGSG